MQERSARRASLRQHIVDAKDGAAMVKALAAPVKEVASVFLCCFKKGGGTYEPNLYFASLICIFFESNMWMFGVFLWIVFMNAHRV